MHGPFICPIIRQPLFTVSLRVVEREIGEPIMALRLNPPHLFGPTDMVLLTEDQRFAYPIVDGIPILLAPEALGRRRDAKDMDLSDPRYAEAYSEMEHYNRVAAEWSKNILDSPLYRYLEPIVALSEEQRTFFPHPFKVWIDAVYDCGAQWAAYQHIGSVRGKRALQLGGSGLHAVKFLLAGAVESWLLTPMLGEAECAIALAKAVGVAQKLHCVVAVAEDIPLRDNFVDVIYSGGCLHHMVTDQVLSEAWRILAPAGRLAATDPWKAPLYSIGTKICGKREENVFCKPLTRERLAPLFRIFAQARVSHHGSLTRYPLLGLSKFGVRLPLSITSRIMAADDLICSCVPRLRRIGSSVAALATKEAD